MKTNIEKLREERKRLKGYSAWLIGMQETCEALLKDIALFRTPNSNFPDEIYVKIMDLLRKKSGGKNETHRSGGACLDGR